MVELKEGADGFPAVSVDEGAEIAWHFGVGRLAHQTIDTQPAMGTPKW